MNEIIALVTTGFTAFSATNLDDIWLLMLYFSQVQSGLRKRQIVCGQYLGFAALVLASLPGFFGGVLLSRPCIGLLGLVPIAIAINRLICPDSDDDSPQAIPAQSNWLSNFLSPQTCGIAAVTFANGGDNIGIYIPLFAHCTWFDLAIILAVFFSLVGVWCLVAYMFTRVPTIATNLTRYGKHVVPFVLASLGILILIDSHTLEDRGLVVLALIISGCWLVALVRRINRSATQIIPRPETMIPVPQKVMN
uniref:Cadmium resistance transporter n=1 Tax=Cyanothece sp. (strain PCC 7425 / ATCC 29141) TaxID=395961 RepID=B8HKX7_CYAP4